MADNEVRGTCEACKHSEYSYTFEGLECRVGAPVYDYKSSFRRFPRMMPHDWCSRFKAREGEND